MRALSYVVVSAIAVVSLYVATGCSSGGGPPGSAWAPAQRQSRLPRPDLARMGIVAPERLASLQTLLPRRGANPIVYAGFPKAYAGLKDLYVDDLFANDVAIFKNGSYKEVGTITDGLYGVDGNFLDKKGNLYVADNGSANVQEYAPGGSSPSFTYSSGMSSPITVSADTQGNVYEADYDYVVNEYAQMSNAVLHSCAPGGNVGGVAVDRSGDVFVDVQPPSGPSFIAEYAGGLKGCHETTLLQINSYGGLAIDGQNNLIACDQLGGAVDVIAPPYSQITGTLGSGYTYPFHVTLNKKNKRAFVVDLMASSAVVEVRAYPSGTVITTLGSANGLSGPFGAVDGPNAVY